MGKPYRYTCLIKSRIFYYKSHDRIRISTVSHVVGYCSTAESILRRTIDFARVRARRAEGLDRHSRLNLVAVRGMYDKIIITIVQSHTANITRLLPLALLLVLRTRNNTMATNS